MCVCVQREEKCLCVVLEREERVWCVCVRERDARVGLL